MTITPEDVVKRLSNRGTLDTAYGINDWDVADLIADMAREIAELRAQREAADNTLAQLLACRIALLMFDRDFPLDDVDKAIEAHRAARGQS